jgi:hypothetical protein
LEKLGFDKERSESVGIRWMSGTFFLLGCSKKKKISPKGLFIAYDVWEQAEKKG